MKGVAGIILVGGGVLLLIALFSGTLHFPLGNVNLGNPLAGLFNTSTPASLQNGVNPSPTTGTTGGVKNINPTVTTSSGQKVVCPVGMSYDPSSGKCVNIYTGSR